MAWTAPESSVRRTIRRAATNPSGRCSATGSTGTGPPLLRKCAGLDDTVTFREKTTSLRWMWQHLVEEYARHNGHADLLREAIDGSAGT